MMRGFGFYGGMGWIGLILELVIAIAIIIGVILLIIWAIRALSGRHYVQGSQPMSRESARDIAQMRYAKGEITREQYQQMLEDMGK